MRFGSRVTVTGHAQGDCLYAFWHQETLGLRGTSLSDGVWTLYDFQYQGVQDGLPILEQTEGSWALPCGSPSLSSYTSIVELCSGMSGMAVGAAFLGGRSLLHVDKSPLACAADGKPRHGVVVWRHLHCRGSMSGAPAGFRSGCLFPQWISLPALLPPRLSSRYV